MDNIQKYSTANGYALRTTTTDFDVETLPIQKQRYGPVLFVFIECTERGARLKRYSLETISRTQRAEMLSSVSEVETEGPFSTSERLLSLSVSMWNSISLANFVRPVVFDVPRRKRSSAV